MPSTPTHLTAGALLALAGLHVAWGRGSAFPFASRAELADAVVGTAAVPGAWACYSVAGALAAASAIVEEVAPLPIGVRRLGLRTIAAVLGLRGFLGLAGRTDAVSPGSTSPRFVRLDRRFYAPLCLALAIGTLAALRLDTVDPTDLSPGALTAPASPS